MDSVVARLRRWRQQALDAGLYTTAETVGDKVVSLGATLESDVLALAHICHASGNPSRALDLVRRFSGSAPSPKAKLVMAQSLMKLHRWDEALELVGDEASIVVRREKRVQPGSVTVAATAAAAAAAVAPPSDPDSIKPEALLWYTRGQILLMQNNFDGAKECYEQAIRADVRCFEAFDRLIRGDLLPPQTQWRLLRSLDFEVLGECAELVKALYTITLGKYVNLDMYMEAERLLQTDYGLADNSDVLLSRVDLLFVQCRFKDCLRLCERILAQDRHKFAVFPSYLACLHELGARNQLYKTAHDLTDIHPDEPVAWLAVAIYYLTIGRAPEARRYFSKASMMNPYFSQAWIGFAHTFALEGEHEQAISAYSTAARLFQGSHLPSLFLGIQYLQLNNLALAEEYLFNASTLCKTDALVLNEMGVVAYHRNELRTAEQYFQDALRAAEDLDADPRAWTSIQANLGHVYRRLDQLDQALAHFARIGRISAKDPNILAAMGLTNLQAGRTVAAIELLHEALSIAPNDSIATDLLTRALQLHALRGLETETDGDLHDVEVVEEYSMEIESD